MQLSELPHFQFFGSEDSQDLDVVFFLEKMPSTIEEKFVLAKAFALKLKEIFPGREINPNLAICKKGLLIDVYKGTIDELNNSLFYTYGYHQQIHENCILEILERDVDLKVIRCIRVVLSLITKTLYRTRIKGALQGNIYDKIEALQSIELNKIQDWGKLQNEVELKKTMAFQLGQTIALSKGVECYTKQQVCEIFPELFTFLYRKESTDLEILQKKIDEFLDIISSRVSQMQNTEEYIHKRH